MKGFLFGKSCFFPWKMFLFGWAGGLAQVQGIKGIKIVSSQISIPEYAPFQSVSESHCGHSSGVLLLPSFLSYSIQHILGHVVIFQLKFCSSPIASLLPVSG